MRKRRTDLVKKSLRLLSLLFALCLAALWLPRTGAAAEGGTTHTVADQESLLHLFTQGTVKDGDTIVLVGDGGVQTANDHPWVIDKDVTITGGSVVIRAGGIVLGGDVTFRDTTLHFTSNVRNAIVANGHTLTLENVACGNFSFNLFCGGFVNSNQETFATPVPAPGRVGTIRIKGSTTLQKFDTYGKGNIYAGNLCMGGMNESTNGPENNGPVNEFDGDAVIHIEGSGDIGTIYACGAQQRIPVGAPNGKVTLSDAARYTVSGSVSVNGNAPDVEGAGAGETRVNYRSDSSYAISRTFSALSSLSVEMGTLELKSGSHSLDGAAVSLAGGAKLNLKALAGRIPTLGDFSGGGILILDQGQTLPIAGTVTGTIRVAIGYTNYDDTQSTTLPTQGHCYIQAPNSQDGAFVLLPYANQFDMALTRDEDGNWTIPVQEEGDAKLESLAPEDLSADSGAMEIIVPLHTGWSGDGGWIEEIPLTLRVNGQEASYNAEDYYYEAAGLHLYVGDTGNGDEFQIYAATSFSDPVPDGVYRIEVVVPGAYTTGETDLAASFTLTVGDDSPPIQQTGTFETDGAAAPAWAVTTDGAVSVKFPATAQTGEKVLVGCYDDDGRFAEVKILNADSPEARISSDAAHIKLFWIGTNEAPLAPSVAVWGKLSD